MREWLGKLKITLATPQLRERHFQQILARENTGQVFESTKERVRYQILDDKQKEELARRGWKRGKESEISPAALFKDVTIVRDGEILVDGETFYMEGGQIYDLALPRKEDSTYILRCLADHFASWGSTLLRLPETDVNVHGEPDREYIGYYNCSGENKNAPSFDAKDESIIQEFSNRWKDVWDDEKREKFIDPQDDLLKQAIITFLDDTGMFTVEQINEFLRGKRVNQSMRNRLWVAYAGWENKPVVLLDNPFDEHEINVTIAALRSRISLFFDDEYRQEKGEEEIRRWEKVIQEALTDVQLDEQLHKQVDMFLSVCSYLESLMRWGNKIIFMTSHTDPQKAGHRLVFSEYGQLGQIFTLQNGKRVEMVPPKKENVL